MSTSLLTTHDLACERDDRLLFSQLNFAIEAGQIAQVKGPNGSGKTTLLKTLAMLYQNYTGRVCWQGVDIREYAPDYHASLLYLGHKPGINNRLTVLENLSFLTGLKQALFKQDLYEALDAVGLSGYEDALCQNLSAGQQRRVGLARLYLSNAQLWILDEAFTAIDLEGVAALENFLAQRAAQGTAIILTTHHQLCLPNYRVLELGAAPDD